MVYCKKWGITGKCCIVGNGVLQVNAILQEMGYFRYKGALLVNGVFKKNVGIACEKGHYRWIKDDSGTSGTTSTIQGGYYIYKEYCK